MIPEIAVGLLQAQAKARRLEGALLAYPGQGLAHQRARVGKAQTLGGDVQAQLLGGEPGAGWRHGCTLAAGAVQPARWVWAMLDSAVIHSRLSFRQGM